MFNNDGRGIVRCVPNEAYRDDCMIQTVQGGGGSVLVWRAFSFAGEMDLHVWDQRVTGVAYCDHILIPKVIPHIQAYPGQNLIFQNDNTPAHCAWVVQQALEQAGIARMDQPPNSPDLNIIEHVWDTLG